MADTATLKALFRVIDAYEHPHGGRILRLRLGKGEAPSLKELKGASFLANGPNGEEVTVNVDGFALFGGRPSDARLARTGRVDIHVQGDGAGRTDVDPAGPEDSDVGSVAQIGPGWVLVGPTGG